MEDGQPERGAKKKQRGPSLAPLALLLRRRRSRSRLRLLGARRERAALLQRRRAEH